MPPGLRNAWIRSSRLRRSITSAVLVLFDSVGIRIETRAASSAATGVHNSRWLQSPEQELEDRSEYRARGLRARRRWKIRARERVLAWTCGTTQTTRMTEITKTRRTNERVNELLPRVFAWAREAGAQQPLTSGCGRRLDSRKAQRDGKDSLEESD